MIQPAPPVVLCRSCVLVMVVSRQPLDHWPAPSSKNISPQTRPDPLVSCIVTLLASTADKHRGSLTHYPTHRAPANRSPYVSLRAVHPILRCFFNPISFILNGLGGLKKRKKQNGFIGISPASFCYLTNETRLFFNSAFRLFPRLDGP